MLTKRCIAYSCLLSTAVVVGIGSSAVAAPVITTVNSSFASTPITFSYGTNTFTFSATGDNFATPTAITTSGGAAVRSFGGFFIFPLQPSTDFPDRGSGILTYGPDSQFSAFDTTTTIPYSNGDNYLGLRATVNGSNYYGYAFTTDTTLNSFGFETTPDTAFTLNTSTAVAAPVPEPASWAMFIGGFGLLGATMRRKRVAVSFG